MLDEKQKDALRRWYRRAEILDEVRTQVAREYWEDLEELLHMRSLIPLSRTRQLPDYLRKDDGSALLPSLDPRNNVEAWQDAIEVGWEVVEAELGLSHDDVHRAIAKQQKSDWSSFMQSVEKRRQSKEEPGS